jgi:hypothetical protein
MRSRFTKVGWIVLALAHVGALIAPSVTRALTPTPFCPYSKEPTVKYECEEWVCVEADRAWDTRPLPFGTRCGPVDQVTGTQLGFCSGTGQCKNPERGRVTPLYMILDVLYSPPADYSSISSTQKRTIGVTTSVGSSFTRTAGAAITVGYDVGLSKGSAELSFKSSDTTGSTDSVTVARQISQTDLLSCDPLYYCTDALDHRLDVITILAKPAVEYAAFPPGTALPTGRKHVSWGIDASGGVQIPLRVGWLTGMLNWPTGLEGDLQYYFGIFPSEYPKILAATGYADAVNWAGNWNPDPSRYELAPLLDGPGRGYYDGAPDFGGSISSTRTIGHEHTYSSSFTVAASVSVGGGIMGKILSATITESASWTWTHSTTTSTSIADETIESFLINMPHPEYSGPRFIWAYLDKLHQTFMFSFCSASYPVPGCASGPPVPLAPTRLTGAAEQTQSSISVSWTPVASATGYTLWRSASPSSGFLAIVSNLDGFAFEDLGATNRSAPYYYKVTALNATGVGPESALAMVPAAPTGLTASKSPDGSTVNLSWVPDFGATSYTVWRSVGTSTPFAKLTCANPAATQCTDTTPPAGTKYLYVVTASSATGSSSRSNQVEVLSTPDAPTGLAATAGNRYVSVRWNAVPGATSYTVEHSTNNSTWSTFTGSSGIWQTYLTESYLTNGVKDYYRVRAFNAAGASPYSTVVSAVPVAPPPPPPPPPPDDTGCPPPPQICQ